MKRLGFIFILISVFMLTSCRSSGQADRNFFAMDTYITVTCYGDRCEEACRACEDEIKRLDALFSVGNEDSEISRINREGGGKVGTDTARLLEESRRVFDMSGGAFDITVYPLEELWAFGTPQAAVPDGESLAKALKTVGSDRLEFDPRSVEVKLPHGGGIDMGGIAKGYAGDRLMEIFGEYGLTGAVASLGGNVICYGKKPGGGKWKCGIRDPFGTPSDIIETVELTRGSAVTSGSYERFFTDEKTGKRYHHILDPGTGYPAETKLLSVTVISESGILADALSTACFVMGEEKAVEMWKDHRDEFSLIFVREDGKVARYQ